MCVCFFLKNLCSEESREKQIIPSFRDIITLAGSAADEAVGVIQRDSEAFCSCYCLDIPSHSIRLQAPVRSTCWEWANVRRLQSFQMMEALLRFLFLFQPRRSLKISPFKSRGGGAVDGSRQMQTRHAVLLSLWQSGPDVSHLFPGHGVKCQQALMQSQRVMDRETLCKRELSHPAGPWGEETDSHHGNLIFRLTHHPTSLLA